MAYPTNLNYNFTGSFIGMQPITATNATPNHPIGTVVKAWDQNRGEGEFIYLKGVASTAAGDIVIYDAAAATTTRATAGSRGPVAVSMSANTTGWGWYQIGGSAAVNSATVLANAPCYAIATAKVDDAGAAGDKIDGMVTRAADSGGFVTAQITRPCLNGNG